MIEIYYVEDDLDIADIVKKYMEEKGCQVTVFHTIAGARQALHACVPSVVLIDLNMPDGQGDSLCRWIRSKWKALPVIFLTVQGDSHDIVSGFQNGTDDYVVKPFDLDVLYSRMQALLRRTGNVTEQYLSCGGIVLDLDRRMVSNYSEEVDLSAAEYDLLSYLMQNKGKTVTRERILEQVWDVNGNYVNDNTLSVTMKRLRDKLGQPSCLKTVRSIGYRMEDTV